MTSTTLAGTIRLRRVRASQVVERSIAAAILLGLVVWLIANIVKNPTLFFSVLLDGLNNGALYALIALGYTLVYGIIELINFAHGDLFMLGTLLTANLMVDRFHLTSPGATAFLGMALTMVIVMLFCGTINVAA